MEMIFGLMLAVVVVVFLRRFGAWMLRIDEVIEYQEKILNELRKANGTVPQEAPPFKPVPPFKPIK